MKYAKTIGQLAAELGYNETSMYRWTNRKDFPKKTKSGWNVERSKSFIIEKKTYSRDEGPKDKLISGSNIGQQRQDKLGLECQLLKIKIEKLKGSLIPMEDYRQDFQRYAYVVDDVFNQFLSSVKLFKNNELLEKSESLVKRTKEILCSKIETLNEEVKIAEEVKDSLEEKTKEELVKTIEEVIVGSSEIISE